MSKTKKQKQMYIKEYKLAGVKFIIDQNYSYAEASCNLGQQEITCFDLSPMCV